jgi:hypothetical protein
VFALQQIGMTPLYSAVLRLHHKTVEILLKAGADPKLSLSVSLLLYLSHVFLEHECTSIALSQVVPLQICKQRVRCQCGVQAKVFSI